MSLRQRVRDIWRKNAPEVIGWWDGSLPEFVTARRPSEPLDGVPVFGYHLVEHDKFEADLAFLRSNGYATLDTTELLDFLNGRTRISPRSVMLTFDDGPRNFYDVAFPLLQKYGAKAVAFIAPGLHAEAEIPDVEARPMTWGEIRTIAASGLVEFQSHTFESRYVPNWPMPAALAGCDPALENARRREPRPLDADLVDSRKAIVAHVPSASVEHLCFPQYIGTDDALRTASSVGFKGCYWGLLKGRPLNRAGQSPLTISRVSDEFLRRLPGEGRVGFGHLIGERLHRIRLARKWRRQYGD